MPTMTKTECIGHIRALANKVMEAWKTTSNTTPQEQEKRIKLIEAHVKTELDVLNRLPESTDEVDFKMCLLGFMTYGSSKNEKYLVRPATSANHDEYDAIINEYLKMHGLLTGDISDLFLNRNRSGQWNQYLRSHPGITEERYHQLMQSQQALSKKVHSTINITTFFSSENNKGDREILEPMSPRDSTRL